MNLKLTYISTESRCIINRHAIVLLGREIYNTPLAVLALHGLMLQCVTERYNLPP